MLREAALLALAIAGLCGPAQAGVLSAADVQRLHDYERFVIPASREIPMLREMGARIDTLIAVAESSGGAFDDAARSDFRSALHDLPRTGGQTLERMVSSLQARIRKSLRRPNGLRCSPRLRPSSRSASSTTPR
jgi:hypothetical protein